MLYKHIWELYDLIDCYKEVNEKIAQLNEAIRNQNTDISNLTGQIEELQQYVRVVREQGDPHHLLSVHKQTIVEYRAEVHYRRHTVNTLTAGIQELEDYRWHAFKQVYRIETRDASTKENL